MLDLTKRDRNSLSDKNRAMQTWQLMIEHFANEAQKNAPKEEPLNGRNIVRKLLTDGRQPRP